VTYIKRLKEHSTSCPGGLLSDVTDKKEGRTVVMLLLLLHCFLACWGACFKRACASKACCYYPLVINLLPCLLLFFGFSDFFLSVVIRCFDISLTQRPLSKYGNCCPSVIHAIIHNSFQTIITSSTLITPKHGWCGRKHPSGGTIQTPQR